jgi:hypothetical protein
MVTFACLVSDPPIVEGNRNGDKVIKIGKEGHNNAVAVVCKGIAGLSDGSATETAVTFPEAGGEMVTVSLPKNTSSR